MRNAKNHLFKPALIALILGFVCPALALQVKDRTSQGNNLGLQQRLGSTVFDGSHEYPRGSGNYIHTYEGGMGHFLSVVRDINGDGIMEDTSYGGGRGRSIVGGRGSLEGYDILKQGFDAGERMDQWCSRVEVNEVWSSLDPDNLARWPAEFREGRTMSGAPILHGKETMCSMLTDCFNRSYNRSTPPLGASFEYQFFFLDYGESNDIAYGHLFIRNMSEYIQWNPNPDFVAKTANTKQGQNWGEWCLMYVENYVGIEKVGSTSMDESWIFHPEKEIKGQVDRDGKEAGFTMGGNTFVIGYKSLRNPSWNGEIMKLTNCNNMRWGSDFGLSVSLDIGVLSSTSQVHRWAKAVHDGVEDDLSDMFKGALSPWTGRPAVGNPGMLLPTDTRFNQWLWGRAGRINYTSWSALHNFGPRDTTSTDFAFMFCYPATPPLVLKPNDIQYIDDPELQAQLAPMEHMGDVVKLVYEGGYILPETPVPPALTIIPGDRRVTITWSNVNLNTPDKYYAFLQQHPEIDPKGYYREYDFEGYRLYRNYTGPQDAHAEMIYQCSLTDNNVQFYYVDTQDKDLSYSRLRNGLKIWYALEPYDRNYDVKTGAEFSLPGAGTSKTWNRPFPEGYHTVRARSDASNFKSASLGAITFQGSASSDAPTAQLTGNGNGKITSAPQLLQPQLGEIELIPVNSERITQDISVNVTCFDAAFLPGGCNWPTGVRSFKVVDSQGRSGNPVDITVRGGSNESRIVLNGPVDSDGISYAVDVTFSELNHSDLYFDWDKGSYTGASAVAAQYRCGPDINSAPNITGWTKNAQYSVTWKTAGNGELTLEVKDVLRNQDVAFGEQPDDFGWGFVEAELIGDRWGAGDNIYNQMVAGTPKNERANKMFQTIPADNANSFGVYLNGIFWVFEDVTSMPAAGTTMTVTTVFGEWNDDQTVFTQYADPPSIGDTWKIDIKAFSMKDEDINLSKIKVVPNPYIASSMLDESGGSRRIDFINLPDKCTIRIYSLGGNLVNVLNHIGASRTGWGNFADVDAIQPDNSPFVFEGYDNHSGTEPWNMKNRFGQTVASGLYFYHVSDARGKTHTGKFYIIN